MQKTKNLWADKVIYQIYPRSFKDSNGDGIGDLKGIIEKLDYLKDTLGIDAIWISPIYKSPMKDFGYDVSDYCDIDPMFGSIDDFDELIREAHARSIKVIMDYIPSHTSIEHPWFKEASSSLNNPKRDWYIWKAPKDDGSVPTNWVSVFGGSMWEFDKRTNEYYLHSFLKEQADLNWRNPEVKNAMLDVLRFWLRKGVDGFRIDAFNHIFKDSEFRDEPLNRDYKEGQDPYEEYSHIYTRDVADMMGLVGEFDAVLKEFGDDKLMVTEAYTAFANLIQLYHSAGHHHMPFNFEFITLDWNKDLYKEFIDRFDAAVGPDYIPTYILGNHDRHRVRSRLGEKGARAAALLQLTLRGMPTIYYGDEIGMDNSDIPRDKVQDPWEINVPGKGLGRDPERTPMQWDESKNAGFTTGEPWLPVDPNYITINVKHELEDSSSMLSLYRSLLKLRKNDTLIWGIYQSYDVDAKDVFVYSREHKGEKILVVINFSKEERKVTLPLEKGKVLLSTYMDKTNEEITGILSVRSQEGYILSV